MIPVCIPTLIGNELKYVNEAVSSNWISSSGKYIEKFEKAFSDFCGVKYGVSCCNGTAALHLALASLGIGKGDEVIIPTFTNIATAKSVIYTGAKPVLVDSERRTWNIDVDKIEEKINEKTRAIMPVHIYGHPCEMDKINRIANKNNLFVVEDAAEAHGAEYKGKRTGSLGHVACFSYFANKIITCGEGGMVLTNDEKIAERARKLRNLAHPVTNDLKKRFFHDDLGFNYRMTNLQAAIGLAQTENADKLVEMRRNVAKTYLNLLKDVKGLTLPVEEKHVKNVYWMFGILIEDKFGKTAEEVMNGLMENGIETRPFFNPIHNQPIFQKKDERFPDAGEFPVAEELGEKGLYLPSTSSLKEKEIRFIVKTITTL